jgi:hypothetical protein
MLRLANRSSPSAALCTSAALVSQLRSVHGKPTTAHKKRTQHSHRWWLQSKSPRLTAAPHAELRDRPQFPGYHEDVDRPLVVPDDACCFNCKKAISKPDISTYVWVPSGNAAAPTKMGYFFHFTCFKCAKCKMRLFHNRFYSKDGQAWCMSCAIGRSPSIPTRRWHTSFVNTHFTGSRQSGHFFPRHKSQMEFLYNPEE